MSIITIELLQKIKEHYALNWYGTHGISHWARVYENGVILSEQPGVNSKVVQLFSIFHDSQRRNENIDEYHGSRGAQLVLHLKEHITLDDNEFQLLTVACGLHTNSLSHEEPTVQVCFDSDRLDLWRIGVEPNPDFLCTPVAKLPTTIAGALDRYREWKMPDDAFGIVGFNKLWKNTL